MKKHGGWVLCRIFFWPFKWNPSQMAYHSILWDQNWLIHLLSLWRDCNNFAVEAVESCGRADRWREWKGGEAGDEVVHHWRVVDTEGGKGPQQVTGVRGRGGGRSEIGGAWWSGETRSGAHAAPGGGVKNNQEWQLEWTPGKNRSSAFRSPVPILPYKNVFLEIWQQIKIVNSQDFFLRCVGLISDVRLFV